MHCYSSVCTSSVYHTMFFTLKCCSSALLQCHLSFPIIHMYVALVISARIPLAYSFTFNQCFFAVLSCHIPSSYTILPPSGLHVAEMDKKDVSRTEIHLDPSIFFRMEGIHVNMSCLSILQYQFHLYDVACFIIKAPFFYTRHARGRRLCQNLKGYKQGLCKRSKRQEIINQLQFLQILLQHKETQPY